MQPNLVCPKCGSSDLLRIPSLPDENSRIAVGERLMHSVHLSQYVCGVCGYVEQWVDDPADLDELRKEYGDERPVKPGSI